MATKFSKSISNGSSALQRRAASLEVQARIAQQAIVDSIKKDKAKLEMDIINLTDFSPESTHSLRPGSPNFDAEVWANDLQEIKMKLWRATVSLKLAEETFEEFFTEIDENSNEGL